MTNQNKTPAPANPPGAQARGAATGVVPGRVPTGELERLTVESPRVATFLLSSVQRHCAQSTQAALDCRFAYQSTPSRVAGDILAELHDSCAALWADAERRLRTAWEDQS